MTHLTTGSSGGSPGRGSPDRARPRLRMLSRRAVLITTLQALVSLAACAAPRPVAGPEPSISLSPSPVAPSPVATSSGGDQVARPTPSQVASCTASLPAVVAPTPIPYPGYAQQEPDTGLHVTSGALRVDLASYRLKVSGLVDRPLSLSYDDLRCLPKVQAEVRLECPGYFVDWATLAGPTIASVIALAGPRPDVALVTLSSVNGYSTHFSLAEAQAEENFLAYEWGTRGEPLPTSHGFPLRAALPSKPGSAWVKWLEEIQLS
jgi:DMSO/TMAO reductase YedYZ molybdopterin-dependent catalytic subunit